jgi:uncharacterized protein (TIGR02118 family)
LAKVFVTYEQPKDQEGFEKHYFGVHIPLVQKLPNLKDATISRVLQSQNTDKNLYLIAQLEYDNLADLNESLASPVGQEVQQDVGNLVMYLKHPPVISIAE